MNALAEQYRGRIIRIVVSDRPAVTYPVNQEAALDDLCELLADCAEAKRLLRANGHGKVGMSVLELVQLLLPAPAAPPTRKRKSKH